MPRGAAKLKITDEQVNAIFERNHGAEMAEYYREPPDARSPIRSTLDPECQTGFQVGHRRLHYRGERL